MKKFILAVLITLGAASSAHAWGPREQGALAGVAGVLLYQQITQPRVVYQQPQVIYTPPPVIYTQPEYRRPPVYSQQYPAPGYPSCTPLYDVNQQYRGCF